MLFFSCSHVCFVVLGGVIVGCDVCSDLLHFKAPFLARSHGDGRLDDATADDWVQVAFGRGQGRLTDINVCAASSLCSPASVRRSQVVAHQALHDGMCKRLRSVLAGAGRTQTIVVKRLWDETGLRVQLSLNELKGVLGEEIAGAAAEVKKRARGGRGSVYPGYVVQSIQQKAFIRYGRDAESSMEIIVPAKIISTTDADSIYNGICSALPAMAPEELERVASAVRGLLIRQFPDAAPANNVVQQYMFEMIPSAVFMSAHCVTHMLQIVWDTGCQKRLSNPLYQLVQLLSNSPTTAKVLTAFESLALECDVLVGVQPQDLSFNSCVLDVTIRRALRTQSFFTEPGGSRHNPESDAAMRESIADTCSNIQRGLSSSWLLPDISHNCWGDLIGCRCCESIATAKERTRSSMRFLGAHCLSSLKPVADNKWRSISNAIAMISPAVLVHGALGRAFKRTLASPAEIRRLKQVVQDHADLIAQAEIEGPSVTDPAAFRALRGKRIVGVNEWLDHRDSIPTLLSFMVGSVPVDKTLQYIFRM